MAMAAVIASGTQAHADKVRPCLEERTPRTATPCSYDSDSSFSHDTVLTSLRVLATALPHSRSAVFIDDHEPVHRTRSAMTLLRLRTSMLQLPDGMAVDRDEDQDERPAPPAASGGCGLSLLLARRARRRLFAVW
mmetsp:Transcript_94417/g.243846  ORF Transcript_94417/g.243846 Transcript_94417/m.243846 type:complete len:135 (-) Transcript_94417:539-943(-)